MSLPNAPVLEVDLAAITRNYRLLGKQFSGKACAGVIKADAYGLGAAEVANALQNAGCKHFFVATLEEAISLRKTIKTLPIYVFHGVGKTESREFLAHDLSPVLNDTAQLQRWAKEGDGKASALHIDSGMGRLGLSEGEVKTLDHALLTQANVELVMSHLACGGAPEHPKNAEQLAAFSRMRALLPALPASFANSSGIFLDPSFHFDLARPGCALYGITPFNSKPNPMENVVRLSAPIIQLRTLEKDETIGYGCLYTARKGDTLATLAMGYADGYFRYLTGKAKAHVNGVEVPVIGRVSMDMIIVDVSHAPSVTPDSRVELIGAQQDVNQIAQRADSIGYEIFTRLGNRVRRVYTNA